MSEAAEIRPARQGEADQIAELLKACGLRADDVGARDSFYLVALINRQVVGVVGLENADGEAVLLRSLAVAPQFRKAGLGRRLMAAIIMHARQTASAIYLFSTGAGDYYRSLGFVETPVDQVVAAVGQTHQVRKYRALGWLATEIGWRKAL